VIVSTLRVLVKSAANVIPAVPHVPPPDKLPSGGQSLRGRLSGGEGADSNSWCGLEGAKNADVSATYGNFSEIGLMRRTHVEATTLRRSGFDRTRVAHH
jgi:hypothetical protein